MSETSTTSRPAAEASIERRFSSEPAAAGEARAALDVLAPRLDETALETARLLVSELVTNSVRHGPGGEVTVRASVGDTILRVEVSDPGDGFTLNDRDRREVGGWGLMLVEQMSDRWAVEPGAPTTVWFEIRAVTGVDAWSPSIDPLLLEAQRAAVVATDLEGTVLRWNRHAEQLYGYPKEAAIGRPITRLTVRPGDEGAAEEIMSRVRRGEVWEGEWLAPRADGSAVWVRVANAPVHAEDGTLIGMIGVSVDISERKAADVALRASEERLRIALESGRMGTWEWDLASGAVRWSESLERIHGLEVGTFGGTFEDFQRDMHGEDRARVQGMIERALDEGTDYFLDYRIVRPSDGNVRWLSVRGQVLRDEDGRPKGMVGVCTDITERKEVERSLAVHYAVSRVLATSQTFLGAAPEILRSIGSALGWDVGTAWVLDEGADVLVPAGDWRAEEVGERFVAVTRGRTFALGQGLPGRVWATGRPVWIPDFANDPQLPRAPAARLEGLHAAFGMPLTVGGNVVGVIEFLSRRMREPDESLLDLMTSVSSQIAQFVERTRTAAELAESEARKTAVFEAALEAIVTMDRDGRIVELNAAAAEMFGYDRDEIVGSEVAEVFIPPSLRERHREAIARYRRTRRGRILGRRLELTGMRADGSEFPVELTVTRVDLPDTDELLFTGYVRDITPRRRADELQAKLFESERAAREESERAHERAAFLAEASVLLAASLDPQDTMTRLASLVVPRLADWCAVDVLREDGSIEMLAVAHVDAGRAELARELRRRRPNRIDDAGGIGAVIATGQPQLIPLVTDDMIDARMEDAERRAFVRGLGLSSVMIVPLLARGRPVGAITFASADPGRRFGEDDLELALDLARRAALAYDNATLYEDRSHVARTLQRTLLPRQLPEIPGIELAAFYQPSTLFHGEVGGDFYDVFGTDDATWNVLVGDVCGKGVEAAALTGLARHTLRATGTSGTPIEALATLNRMMLREDGERFCTVALGVLRRTADGLRLRVACGGHPAPLVIRTDGRVEPVGAPGSLLGVFDEVEFEERSTDLFPGDLVVLYTDGLVDARVAEPLDEAALRERASACAGRTAKDALVHLTARFTGPDAGAADDTCVLVIRVTG